VFLNVDLKTKPLAPRLIELEEKFSAFGFVELRLVETLSFSSPWNWKTLIENFLDSYHHMGTHPQSRGNCRDCGIHNSDSFRSLPLAILSLP
jgi:phenylpropionate dioxygenase-like ring-hydroxylating dioxygenase large terminal subunit